MLADDIEDMEVGRPRLPLSLDNVLGRGILQPSGLYGPAVAAAQIFFTTGRVHIRVKIKDGESFGGMACICRMLK